MKPSRCDIPRQNGPLQMSINCKCASTWHRCHTLEARIITTICLAQSPMMMMMMSTFTIHSRIPLNTSVQTRHKTYSIPQRRRDPVMHNIYELWSAYSPHVNYNIVPVLAKFTERAKREHINCIVAVSMGEFTRDSESRNSCVFIRVLRCVILVRYLSNINLLPGILV